MMNQVATSVMPKGVEHSTASKRGKHVPCASVLSAGGHLID
jgi:hypothetical protein